jgi:hypothetical protein
MQAKTVARYGTWPSPVSPELVAGATVSFGELAVDRDAVTWLELRPAEGGRTALVRWTAGTGARDVLPADANVGSRVHEYGGGAYAARDGRTVYSERGDGSVWLIEADGSRRPLVLVPGCRYAGFAIDAAHDRVYVKIIATGRRRLPGMPSLRST